MWCVWCFLKCLIWFMVSGCGNRNVNRVGKRERKLWLVCEGFCFLN